MFSPWADIPIRYWEAVIMSTAAKQPPHILSPPVANFWCFREGIKPSRKRDMHQVSNYFFLGFHWWPAATLKHGCHVIEYRNSVSKAVKPRWLLSDLLKISTNQLCRTHSKLRSARNILLSSCSSFCDFKKSPFQPMDSFAHTALCGGEVQRCRFWEPLLGFSLFFPQWQVT